MARDLSPEWALAALAGSGFLFAAALVYPAGMGMGDVKLALFMGAALGRAEGEGVDDQERLEASLDHEQPGNPAQSHLLWLTAKGAMIVPPAKFQRKA